MRPPPFVFQIAAKGFISPPLEVLLFGKRKWRSAGGSMGQGRRRTGGERGGAWRWVPPFFFLKARFSPDTSVLFINSFSSAVKNQCALHCKQFIMMGDGRRGRGGVGAKKKKKLNCNRIDLFKYNNTALQRGEEEAAAARQRLTGSMKPRAVIDKLLATRKAGDSHWNVSN